jgi:hypothetical protein
LVVRSSVSLVDSFSPSSIISPIQIHLATNTAFSCSCETVIPTVWSLWTFCFLSCLFCVSVDEFITGQSLTSTYPPELSPDAFGCVLPYQVEASFQVDLSRRHLQCRLAVCEDDEPVFRLFSPGPVLSRTKVSAASMARSSAAYTVDMSSLPIRLWAAVDCRHNRENDDTNVDRDWNYLVSFHSSSWCSTMSRFSLLPGAGQSNRQPIWRLGKKSSLEIRDAKKSFASPLSHPPTEHCEEEVSHVCEAYAKSTGPRSNNGRLE